METLSEKVAVVTGGGSGIGRSIALALANEGTHVVIADVQLKSAEAVVAEVRARGVRSIAVEVDVSVHSSVVALADRAYEEFGRVDILCNNAGVSWRPFRTILGATMDDWKFLFGINLWGVVHGLDVFLPRMRRQHGEKYIVNTSSIAGLVPLAGHIPYSASKASVAFISEALAQELAPEGFGVTILCPGFVNTNVAANSDLLRPEAERSTSRQFEPYNNPLLKRLSMTAMEPEIVGMMVCNAIVDGTLYLNPQAVPEDVVAERTHIVFGRQTQGRVS